MYDKKRIVFYSMTLVIVSILISIICSLIVNIFASQTIPYGVHLGDLNISGLTLRDADKRIDGYYPEFIKNRSVTIEIEQKIYTIPMEEIGVRLDKTKSINDIMKENGINRIYTVVEGIFGRKKRIVEPVFFCDESLLKKSLMKIKQEIDRIPTNAYILLKGDKLEKNPDVYGLEINIDSCANTIKGELEHGIIGAIRPKPGMNKDYKHIRPLATMSDIENINAVLASTHTEITDDSIVSSIKIASKALNNVFIPRKFSFFDCLKAQDYKMQKYNPGVNQVASTLYKALVDSGFPNKDIEIIVDLEKGKYKPDIKKIKVTSNEVDFKFMNNKKSPVIILSNIKDGAVYVNILGQK